MSLTTLIEFLRKDNKKAQFLRFAIVGVIAAAIHYAIYLLLWYLLDLTDQTALSIAYTAGYILSWFCNLYLTSIFTFRSKATFRKSVGFAGAHVVNYFLHIILLNLFLWLNVPEWLAPFFVMSVATPINFFLVRFVFKHKS